jgi:hypothetical protein
MVIGIAVKVIAARHAPLANRSPTTYLLSKSGWSPTAYDVVTVVGWTLVIAGIIVAAFAVARESTRGRPSNG